MIRLLETTGGVPRYQLKITLLDSQPAIWRRIVVPASFRLDQLHQVIQEVMPWTNSHMHQFIAGDTYYGRPDPDAGMVSETLNEKKFTLADLAPGAKKKFIYEYDFGDGWEHEIVVEKVLPPDAGFKKIICLAGQNACPPDDCGGIPGYDEMLKIIGNPKHPDHAHWKEWLGGEWDAARFDLDEANAALKRFKI